MKQLGCVLFGGSDQRLRRSSRPAGATWGRRAALRAAFSDILLFIFGGEMGASRLEDFRMAASIGGSMGQLGCILLLVIFFLIISFRRLRLALRACYAPWGGCSAMGRALRAMTKSA